MIGNGTVLKNVKIGIIRSKRINFAAFNLKAVSL